MLGAALWAQTAPKSPSLLKPPAAPAAPVAANAAPAVAADKVVLTLGAFKMTRSDFDAFMASLSAEVRQSLGGDTPEARRKLATQMSEMVAYGDEAKRLKLDEKPATRVLLLMQQQQALAQLLYTHLQEQAKPSAADSAAWYEKHKNEYLTVTARHILVRYKGSRVPQKEGKPELSEAEALAKATQLRERITKGEDFAAVAKAESDDTTTGAKGGDLGSFGRGQMVAAFESAAFTQPVGEVGQPVKTPFGYHLIQVQEKAPKPFADVEAEMAKKMSSEGAQKGMKAVQESAKANMDEAYFGAPAPAAPAAPAQLAPGTPAKPAAVKPAQK
jgi:parvulin-like peptidyl-prolyl isomerase